MALFKKKEAEQAPPTAFEEHDTSVGTAADVEAVMKKYDRESTPGSGKACRTGHPLADGFVFPLLHH